MKVDKRREIFPLGPKQRNTLAAAGVFERYNVSCSNQTALHYRSSPDGLYVAISLLVEDLRRRLYPDQQWIKHAYTHATAHPIGVAWEYLVLFAHFVFTSLHVSPTNKRPSRLFHGPRAYHFGIPHTPVPRPRRDRTGASLYWRAPTREDDIETQISLVEHVAQGNYQGLVLAPDQALSLISPVRLVLSRRIPTVIIGSRCQFRPERIFSISSTMTKREAGWLLYVSPILSMTMGR